MSEQKCWLKQIVIAENIDAQPTTRQRRQGLSCKKKCLEERAKKPGDVNLTNILRVALENESVLCSFSVLTVCV